MNEEGEMKDGAQEGGIAKTGVTQPDPGDPHLDALFKEDDTVEVRNMKFRVLSADGALMTLRFLGFTNAVGTGGDTHGS